MTPFADFPKLSSCTSSLPEGSFLSLSQALAGKGALSSVAATGDDCAIFPSANSSPRQCSEIDVTIRQVTRTLQSLIGATYVRRKVRNVGRRAQLVYAKAAGDA